MSASDSFVLPVGVVCGYVKRIFESEEMLHNITVLGEVSNLKVMGGYAYFNLKDNEGLLSCVCFGLYKTEIPKDGDKVFVSGSISFYPKGGKVSFIVNKIYYTGKGDLLLFYQQLKERLEEEGLFDADKKKNIPRFPSSVCVVTSKSGAAIRDVITTIRKKNKNIDISVVDVRVQGEGSVDDIVKGLALADKIGADVIILARGGGSYEDLLSFCDEKVVRAVYNAKTPIISAVGHETDVTLVDYVSDVRVATPTAAGELVTYDQTVVLEYVFSICNRFSNSAMRSYENNELKVKNYINNLSAQSRYFYEKAKNRYVFALNRMTDGIKEVVNTKSLDAQRIIERINSANPLKTLSRGIYKVYSDGMPLVSANNVQIGSEILLESIDAKINAKVISIEEKNIKIGEDK